MKVKGLKGKELLFSSTWSWSSWDNP